MSLKLVVIFAAAVLALTQGAPLSPVVQSRLSQRLFQSCNPHLRLPNGSRMAVDLVSYYNEIDPKCLGGLVMAAFKIQKRVKLFETEEDTAICHGFIELLSLIDAYNWTKEMCDQKAIADERIPFCQTYKARQNDISRLTLMYNATEYDHLTVVGLLLSRMGEENCKEFCYGMMNSTLCNSFVDASSFFLKKFHSDPPQEKIIIPEESTTKSLPSRTEFQVPRLPASQVPRLPASQVPRLPASQVPRLPASQVPHLPAENMPARVPAVPARPTADGASSDKDARELYLMMKKVLQEMRMEKAGSTLGTQDKPTIISTITASSTSQVPRLPAENMPARVPAVPARPTADDASSDKDARELYLMMQKVLQEMRMEKAGSTLGTQAKPTTITASSPTIIQPPDDVAAVPPNSAVRATVPVSPTSLVPTALSDTVAPSEERSEEEPEDANTVLEEILDELDMTKDELLDLLGPDFQGDLNRMTADEILDALEEAEEEEEEPLTPEYIADFEPWEEEEEDTLTTSYRFGYDVVNAFVEPSTPWVEEKIHKEVRSRSWYFFFTIILILSVVVIGGYLCVHNWKRDKKGKDQREAVVRVKTFRSY